MQSPLKVLPLIWTGVLPPPACQTVAPPPPLETLTPSLHLTVQPRLWTALPTTTFLSQPPPLPPPTIRQRRPLLPPAASTLLQLLPRLLLLLIPQPLPTTPTAAVVPTKVFPGRCSLPVGLFRPAAGCVEAHPNPEKQPYPTEPRVGGRRPRAVASMPGAGARRLPPPAAEGLGVPHPPPPPCPRNRPTTVRNCSTLVSSSRLPDLLQIHKVNLTRMSLSFYMTSTAIRITYMYVWNWDRRETNVQFLIWRILLLNLTVLKFLET